MVAPFFIFNKFESALSRKEIQMKKFITILISLALIVAMAVPVFAEETYTVSGVWTFNETISRDGLTANQSYQVNATMGNNNLSAIKFEMKSGGNYYFCFYDVASQRWLNYGNDTTNDYEIGGLKINFGTEPQMVDVALYNWLMTNAEPSKCDGSTCPATDVNQDNICDDCGGQIEKADTGTGETTPPDSDTGTGETTPDSGGTGGSFYPNSPADWDKVSHPYGFMMENTETGELTFYAYNVTLRRYADGRLGIDGPAKGVKSVWTSNGWGTLLDLDVDDGVPVRWNDPMTLVRSSHNVYNADGTLFFRVTPTLTEVVTQETLAGVMTQVVMMIPVGLTCLIGYLALRKALRVLETVLSRA